MKQEYVCNLCDEPCETTIRYDSMTDEDLMLKKRKRSCLMEKGFVAQFERIL